MPFGRAANDIEHGVLRGNAASPASPFVLVGLPQLAGKTFRKGDPRLAQVLPRPGQRKAGPGARVCCLSMTACGRLESWRHACSQDT